MFPQKFKLTSILLVFSLSILGLIKGGPSAESSGFCSELSFVSAQTESVSGSMKQVIVEDFNNDGLQDLVEVGIGRGNVLLGNGQGHFGPSRPFELGNGAIFAGSGDFNSDGNKDLALVVNLNDDQEDGVALSLGDGQGSFGVPIMQALGSNPQALAVGDFNGDSNLDVAVTNRSSQDVSILLGNGAGSLTLSTTLAASGFTNYIAVSDFNDDGNLDLAVPVDNGSTNFVSIFLGDGAGTFSLFTNLPLLMGTNYLVVADFNNDGDKDVAIQQSDKISVRLGNGLGDFSAPNDFLAGGSTAGVAGDFDNDGKYDLAIRSGGVVAIILGDGMGGFRQAERYAAGLIDQNRPSIAVGNLNSDENLDLVAASSGPAFIFIGKGDGSFLGARDFVAGPGALALVTGDFNGDGVSDLAATSTGADEVWMLLGSGGGEFGPPTKHQVGTFPKHLAIGDFNGDNKPDLAVTNFTSNNVSILIGNGGGGFSPFPNVSVGSNPEGISINDFNNDGIQDLAVAKVNPGNLSIVLGQGNGTFQAANTVPLPIDSQPFSINSADINTDGKADLVVAGTGSELRLSTLLGNGLGGFGPPNVLNQSSLSVAIGDFNDDGHADLLSHSGANITVLLGNGNGAFSAEISRPAPLPGGPVLTVGDFNRDGKLDAVAATLDQSVIEIYTGDGTGALGAPKRLFGGSGLGATAVGDFNGDGKQDLAAPNYAGGATIFINDLPCTPDSAAPIISCDAPDGLWHASDVNLNCVATDSGSGLDNSLDANFTLSTSVNAGTETSNSLTNSRTVCDLAGNCSTAGPIGGNRVDKKAPAIGIIAPVDMSSTLAYLLGQSVLSNFNCSDSGSGVATCIGAVANGIQVNTSTVGTKSFSVTTVDAVGNAANASITYGVTYAVFMLYNTNQNLSAKTNSQIKIQLQNASGMNQSSGSLAVTALRVTPRGNPSVITKGVGGTFTFDAALTFHGSAPGGGYKYTLDLSGLTSGAYDLIFNVANDPIPHAAPFNIK